MFIICLLVVLHFRIGYQYLIQSQVAFVLEDLVIQADQMDLIVVDDQVEANRLVELQVLLVLLMGVHRAHRVVFILEEDHDNLDDQVVDHLSAYLSFLDHSGTYFAFSTNRRSYQAGHPGLLDHLVLQVHQDVLCLVVVPYLGLDSASSCSDSSMLVPLV